MYLYEAPTVWYIVVALIGSAYQAYRGFMFQGIFGIDVKGGAVRRILLLCLADMLTYFLCAITGYAALWASVFMSPQDNTLSFILVLYSVLGVTGKLPDALHRIPLPSGRKDI